MNIAKLKFYGNCINRPFTQARFDEIVFRNSKQIGRKSFLPYINVDELKEIEKALGYSEHHTQGLTMSADDCVTYYTSFYSEYGSRYTVVFFKQSSVEYFFK